MDENIKRLRKEAYKIWGISNREVVFDMPSYSRRFNGNKFQFKIDCSSKHESWPRSYKLSMPIFEDGELIDNKTYSRVIVPIMIYKDYMGARFFCEAWYDMPEDTHVELLLLTEHPRMRKLNIFQKAFNKLFRTNRFKEECEIESYIFEVFQNEDDLSMSIIG